MDILLLPSLQGVLECCSLVFIGHQLRQNGLFRPSDGLVAMRVASFTTLPSLAFQSLCSHGPIHEACWAAVASGCLCMAAQSLSSWIFTIGRAKRERAVLSGSSIGSNLHFTAIPLVTSLFPNSFAFPSLSPPSASLDLITPTVPIGIIALQAVILLDLFNQAMVHLASYLAFGSSGPAFPSSYKHEDGGTYKGQWRGMKKEGLGVYSYPSGARYEGEWRDNFKDGRGVYFFNKGGTYEGEWSGGNMNGLGIRTYSTGQVKAGRWVNGEMQGPALEIWQVAIAAEGAAEASVAARKVQLGGGTLLEALEGLMASPMLWACLIALTLNLSCTPLPLSIDMATRVLAPANKPLTLLALGITLSSTLGLKQLGPVPSSSSSSSFSSTSSSSSSSSTSSSSDVSNREKEKEKSSSFFPAYDYDSISILARRLAIPSLIGAVTFILQGTVLNSNLSLEPALYLAPMTAVTLALLSPLSSTASSFCRLFRLSEIKTSSLLSLSYLLGLPAMITFGLLSSSLILRPLSVQSFSFNLMNYTDINATIIGLACLVLTLACAALLALRAPSSQTNGSSGVNSLEYQNGPMVRMIYAPNMQPRSDEDTVSDTRQQGEGDGGFRGVIRPRGRPSPSALPSPSPLPFYCLHNTRRRLAVKPLHLSRTLSRSIAAKALVRKV